MAFFMIDKNGVIKAIKATSFDMAKQAAATAGAKAILNADGGVVRLGGV